MGPDREPKRVTEIEVGRQHNRLVPLREAEDLLVRFSPEPAIPNINARCPCRSSTRAAERCMSSSTLTSTPADTATPTPTASVTVTATGVASASPLVVDDGSTRARAVASNVAALGNVWNSLAQSFTAEDIRVSFGFRLKDTSADLPNAGASIVYNL